MWWRTGIAPPIHAPICCARPEGAANGTSDCINGPAAVPSGRFRVLRESTLRQVALEAAHHLGSLVVRAMPRLRGRTGEGAELPVPRVSKSRDDVTALVEVRVQRRHLNVD